MRRAELKVTKLREVVEALHKGEEVDVEKALGTGDEGREREWEEALREIEHEDRLWHTNRQKGKEDKSTAREEAAQDAKIDTASPINNATDQLSAVEEKAPLKRDGGPAPPGFY